MEFVDLESGQRHTLRRSLRHQRDRRVQRRRPQDRRPSRSADDRPEPGRSLVLDRSFLPGDAAIMVPRTSDGRVLFAIPWHGHTLLGTTDTPIAEATLEPVAQEQEIDFILDTASHYLSRPPTRADILSVFAGIRPLVKASEATAPPSCRGNTQSTSLDRGC